MALLMFGVILHGLIPIGFMPDTSNGKITLVICSGMGEKTVVIDAKDHPQSGDERNASGHDAVSSCPYFIAQFPGLQPDQPTMPIFGMDTTVHAHPHDDGMIGIAFTALPPARGPPPLFM